MSDEDKILVERIRCEECNGQGTFEVFVNCARCSGRGTIGPYKHPGDIYSGERCPTCKPSSEVASLPGYGVGLVHKGTKKCVPCAGHGYLYIKTENHDDAFAALSLIK